MTLPDTRQETKRHIKPRDGSVGLLRRLRFRFGFVVQGTGELDADAYKGLVWANWRRQKVGSFDVLTHPEARIETFACPGLTILVIGDAFVETAVPLSEAMRRVSGHDESTLFALLEELAGRFALLAVSTDRIRVFHDPIGSQAVYYHAQAPLALASHVELLALAVRAKKNLEMAAYMADPTYLARRVRYLPGDQTIYQHILALPPNMLFDSASMATRRFWPLRPRSAFDIREFQDVALASLGALARYLSKEYTPVLGMTGGVDSRAALAAFLMAGVQLETITWNPSRLDPGEADIIDQLVRGLGFHHEYLSFPERAGQVGRLASLNSGGMFLRNSKLCTALRRRYKDRDDVALIRGWGGEVVRVYYNHKISPMRSFDPKEMARVFLAEPQGAERSRVTAAHRKQTEACFAAFSERGSHAELGKLGYDPNDIFYLEHRMGMWVAAANAEVDTATRSLVAYNSRRLFSRAFGLPLQQRLSKSLLLDIAVKCDPAYGQVPLTGSSDSLRSKVRNVLRYLRNKLL